MRAGPAVGPTCRRAGSVSPPVLSELDCARRSRTGVREIEHVPSCCPRLRGEWRERGRYRQLRVADAEDVWWRRPGRPHPRGAAQRKARSRAHHRLGHAAPERHSLRQARCPPPPRGEDGAEARSCPKKVAGDRSAVPDHGQCRRVPVGCQSAEAHCEPAPNCSSSHSSRSCDPAPTQPGTRRAAYRPSRPGARAPRRGGSRRRRGRVGRRRVRGRS